MMFNSGTWRCCQFAYSTKSTVNTCMNVLALPYGEGVKTLHPTISTTISDTSRINTSLKMMTIISHRGMVTANSNCGSDKIRIDDVISSLSASGSSTDPIEVF